jgi:hypothetical protein
LILSLLLSTSLAATAWAGPPKMKMTTEIPASIKIPDAVETRLCTLRFEDGFPTEETAQKVYDQLDFQRAVESVIMTTPGGPLAGFRKGTVKPNKDGSYDVYFGPEPPEGKESNWVQTVPGTCCSASMARNRPGSTRPGGRARSS